MASGAEKNEPAAKRGLKPSLDWLLLFVPIAVILEIGHSRHAPWAGSTWIFITSCVAVIPLAGWMGRATEHLAERVGAGIGGLLNATFGNAAELIIALLFLVDARMHPEKIEYNYNVVKASLTGSIIGNIVLVLGASLLAGGLKHSVQRFNATAARTGSTMLWLAAISLMIPAAFAALTKGRPGSEDVSNLSLEISVLLLIVYVFSLLFSLRTHKHLYLGETVASEAAHVQDEAHPGGHWSVRKSLIILLVAAAFVGLMSEFLVGSVEEASKTLGMSDLFVGVIVVAIIGNAAEHSSAVLMAYRNRMDLSIGIAVGSSIQIALFVAPVLVLASYALGHPMDLVFHPAEVMAVAVSVLVVAQIAGDGESNWLEGVQLLALYTLLGMLFYYL